ncbi:MAG: CRISPR-associated helicase Cas3' [Chloroflexi bacterium]|nr:CRISPR-associated helicase Cas3' [Chloroflexota bacterium]
MSAWHNVILQAPTGAGKTRAAIYPFLYMLDEPHYGFPTKCLYSVPMRVLAKQFVHEYRQIAGRYALRSGQSITTSIQTGEQPDDRELSANLIFATIDQTLSSFLNRPYSLSRSRGNLNAGAVMASYLVFDEFHLFDPESTLPTTLHMLQLLNGITPFILMTATFSRAMLEGLAQALNAVVVPGSDDERAEMQHLQSQQKTRRYHTPEQPLSAEAVLENHTGRSLVICNTVDRARHLYQMINDRKDAHTDVLLLHARFLKDDRSRVEDIIRDRFGKGNRERDYIVVSTQAIEVGLDITSTVLHTELAPANAIIQRAGRCARYQGETGDVYIYRHALDPKGETPALDLCENVNPYAGQKAEFAATFDQFAARSGQVLTFDDEQAIISVIHGPRDERIVEQLKSGELNHRRAMFAVMRGQDDAASELIRNVFQQRVTISANPDELLDSPFDAPAFSLYPGTLQGYIKDWLERADQLSEDVLPRREQAVLYLYQLPRDKDPDAEQENRPRYRWLPVDTPETAKGASLLVVHPALASYHSNLGFLADRPSDLSDPNHWEAQLPPKDQRSEGSRFSYSLETYEDHINQVYHAAFDHDGFWHEMAGTAARLERLWGWQSGSIQRAAEITVLLHDVGKLSQRWQGWVREYQKRINKPIEPGKAYAHTECRTQEQREKEKAMPRRPWHAVEGAIACIPILEQAIGDNPALLVAAYSAIARHHAPYSAENRAFRLHKQAINHIWATFPDGIRQAFAGGLVLDGIQREIPNDFDPQHRNVIEPRDDLSEAEIQCYLAYLLLVRVLRRADQRGTARGTAGISPGT